MNPLLTKNYDAGGAIAKHRFVKFGASDTAVVQAAADDDFVIGVNEALDVVTGEPVDVILAGIPDVEFGGSVTRGAEVMSDADGKAITAVGGAGVRVAGIAMMSGADGDIGKVLLAQGSAQDPNV